MHLRTEAKSNSNITDINLILDQKPQTLTLSCHTLEHACELFGDIIALKKIYEESRTCAFQISLNKEQLQFVNLQDSFIEISEFLEFSKLLAEKNYLLLKEEIKKDQERLSLKAANQKNILTASGKSIFTGSYSTTHPARDSLSSEENALALEVEKELIAKLAPLSQPLQKKILNDLIHQYGMTSSITPSAV